MNYINTIEELTYALDNVDPLDYAKIMKKINITEDHISEFATWSSKCYTRNCLARTNKYEVILLCWDIGAESPIHCHDGKDCWVYQVNGELEEKRFNYNKEELIETHNLELKPNKLTYMHDRMGYHSIGNSSTKRAMSLHIYASPIDSCTIYNDDNQCFDPQELSYDTFKGVEV